MLLRQLEYVVAVDDLKNFTKAADRCCITQSTLSLQIKSLEDFLGIQIFDRTTLPVKLTKEGEMLIEEARAIVEQAKKFERYAKSLKTNTQQHADA
jgi:LysR family transcriptional regulator, hydrogen peroxide-inducible genes activator